MAEKRQLLKEAIPIKEHPKPQVELLRYSTSAISMLELTKNIARVVGDVARTVRRMLYFVNKNALHHYMFDTPVCGFSPCGRRRILTSRTRMLIGIVPCRIATTYQYYCAG